jgi:asparagine synthase (glutamine-hydrolysing)
MCGIVGIVGRQQDAWLRAMNRLQRHRGPDDEGEYRDVEARVALAMTRLSILDLAHGHQPMTSASGESVIVFNGEIFNSPELRRRLEGCGVKFQTQNSDTEVLLALWEQRRERMLDDLNGMFAFVIHDRKEGVVFGARDPLGIKPFYYSQRSDRFAFASELKALLAVPDVARDIDFESLYHYVSLRFVPGASSIFKEIRRLPPGHYFVLRPGSNDLKVAEYWSMAFDPDLGVVAAEWPMRIRDGLRQAVRRWALSDVPIGCSLSGGLDSSTLVGLLGESGGGPVRTYSLGFAEEEGSELNELPLARQVAARYSTEHHEIILTADDLLRDLLQMVWHLDEPYGGGLPSWYVFAFMAKDVKVGLTGSGSDELFGDYGRFRQYEQLAEPSALGKAAERLAATAPRAARALAMMGTGWARDEKIREFSLSKFRRDYFDRYYYFTDDDKRKMLFERPVGADTAAMLAAHAAGDDPRDAVTAASMATQLPDEFLAMTDRFSMAHSLEARVPFLDREFVALMASIPASARTRPGDLKYLLKRAVDDLLPAEVLRGRKRGFVIPTASWLRGRLRPLVERLLGPDYLRSQGIFQPDLHRTVVAPHLAGRVDRHAQIWTLLMFQLWHAVFVERTALDQPAAVWSDLC